MFCVQRVGIYFVDKPAVRGSSPDVCAQLWSERLHVGVETVVGFRGISYDYGEHAANGC